MSLSAQLRAQLQAQAARVAAERDHVTPSVTETAVVTKRVTQAVEATMVLVDGPAAAVAYAEAEKRGMSAADWVASLILSAGRQPKPPAERMRDMRARRATGKA